MNFILTEWTTIKEELLFLFFIPLFIVYFTLPFYSVLHFNKKFEYIPQILL
jgi:hypothetical protein